MLAGVAVTSEKLIEFFIAARGDSQVGRVGIKGERQMNDSATRLQNALRYQNDFQQCLACVMREAIDDELLSATVHYSLYTPNEVTAGINAGESARLPASEAATCFAFVSAAAFADRTKRTLWGRLKAKREPKVGSPEYHHLQIFNVVMPALDRIGRERVGLFADLFAKELQANI